MKADVEVSQCVDHIHYTHEPLILTMSINNMDI